MSSIPAVEAPRICSRINNRISSTHFRSQRKTPETQYGRRLRKRLAMRLARSPRFETLPELWISQTTSTGFPVLWVQDPLLHQVTDCLQTDYCDVLSAKLQDLSTRTCQCQCIDDARPRSKRSRMPGTRNRNSGPEFGEYAAFAKTALARNHEGK